MSKKHWNEFYLKNDTPPWANLESFEEAKKAIDRFVKREYFGGKVLDFGCGTSPYYVKYFTEKGYDVVCTDISDTAIEKRKAEDSEYKNVTSFSFENIDDLRNNIKEKFDIIFCWGVLHHVSMQKREEIISLFKEIIKDDGVLIVSGWDKQSENFSEELKVRKSEIVGSDTFEINQIEQFFRPYYFEEVSCGSYFHIVPDNKERLIMKFYILEPDVELKKIVENIKREIDSRIFFHDVIFNFDNISEVSLSPASTIWFKDSDIVQHIYDNGRKNISSNTSLAKTIYEKQQIKKNLHIAFNIDPKATLPSTWETLSEDEDFYSAKVTFCSNEEIKDDYLKRTHSVADKFRPIDFFFNSDIIYNEIDTSNIKYPSDFLTKDVKDIICKFFYSKDGHYEFPEFHFYFFMHKAFRIRKNDICAVCILIVTREEISKSKLIKIDRDYISWSSKRTTSTFYKFVKQQAVKSAIAAIMSRNMSHNLGSHVMSYLKQHLHSVEDIARRNALVDLITSENWQSDISTKIKQGEDSYTEMPFLVGLGRFISYLQERQDFIATICTDYIPYFSSINFKDFIYDELNPDLRCVRHFGKKDVEGKVTDNLLLKFIAKSEGLSRKLKKINNRSFDFENNNIILKFDNFNGMDKDHPDLERMRKIDFSLPGGIIGRQAFFSVIENIIRNAAKHGNRTKEHLELTISIFDYNAIKDANIGWQAEYKEKEEIRTDDLYIITITDNLKNNGNAVEKLREAINDEYIDESGKLKETNKGIKEMRISAAYLRGIGVIDENNFRNNNEKAPILQVTSAGDKENFLQYIFCVPKCKKIAFVVANSQQVDFDACNENLQKIHCKLFAVDDFQKEAKMNYDIIAIKDGNIYNDILSVVHSRIVEKDFGDELNKQFSSLLPLENSPEDYVMPVDEYLSDLYSRLKSINGIDKIYIRDDNDGIFDNQLLKSQTSKTAKIELISDSDLITNGVKGKECYCYRKHHDTESEFNKFMQEIKPPHLKFIESITGGNSTDRLIRREPQLNDLWFYRHANAMNTSVAIFDERLFTKITGIEQSELEEQSGNVNKIAEILKKYEEKGNLQGAKQEIIEFLGAKTDRIKNSFINSRDTFELLRNYCAENIKTRVPQYSTNYQAVVFHQKKIDFFTCIYDSTSQCFEIWGYAEEQRFETGNYCAKYDYLGEIRKEGKSNIAIDLLYTLKGFDYLSIHQGLLDKIYDRFDIPKAEKDNENKERFEVTNKLFDKFIDQKYQPIGNFLPRLIVHSGRSKPAFQDLPQKQPFIQYSAIENAVMDCKYTLVDLLDHAHHEK